MRHEKETTLCSWVCNTLINGVIQLQDAVERPIIFVCHSLGGIVVKKTLLYCDHLRHPKTQHIRSTYISTYAILFMGTPHNGSDLANLGSAMQTLFNLVPKKLFDTTPNLLKTLRPDNEILQNVNRQFAEIMGRFRIYFFHESKPMDLKGTRKFIVDESSAAPVIEGVERMGIEADHSAMCRFENAKSPGYEAVGEAVLRYTKEAPGEIANRWAQEHRARRNNMREEAERLRKLFFHDFLNMKSRKPLPQILTRSVYMDDVMRRSQTSLRIDKLDSLGTTFHINHPFPCPASSEIFRKVDGRICV